MNHQRLHRCALFLTQLCICILPATNARLPFTTQPWLPWIAGLAWTCWVVSRIAEKRLPGKTEAQLWCFAGSGCGLGLLMTLFPRAMVERGSGVILDLDKPAWLAFGTIDQGISIDSMISIAVALALLLMAFDFGRNRGERIALGLSVMLSGFMAAMVGLVCHSRVELQMIWGVTHVPESVFGLFWYHGNLAAFLNMCWPVTLWLGATLLQRGVHGVRQQLLLALLTVALLVQIIAVFVNVSKMGHLMVIAQGVCLLICTLILARRSGEGSLGKAKWLVLAVAGVSLLALCLWLAGAGEVIGRWNIFALRNFDDPARRHSVLMALKIGMDNLWTGTGPGTFEWAAAHYYALDPVIAGGRWRHAHNDYAEFFVEWGAPGALLMLLGMSYLGRRVLRSLRSAAVPGRGIAFQRQCGLICCFVAVAVTWVHALVDFPLQISATRHLFAVLNGLLFALASNSRRGGNFRLSE